MELESDNHEVLWVILSPRRLPRGYSNIITAVIYHPPDGNSRVYPFFPITYWIFISFQFFISQRCGYTVIAGDFNKLDLRSTVKIFHPNLVINLPTRGANIPTSFPGSSLFLRKDPGRGWSRDPADSAW
jgi:hypothetical protein